MIKSPDHLEGNQVPSHVSATRSPSNTAGTVHTDPEKWRRDGKVHIVPQQHPQHPKGEREIRVQYNPTARTPSTPSRDEDIRGLETSS